MYFSNIRSIRRRNCWLWKLMNLKNLLKVKNKRKNHLYLQRNLRKRRWNLCLWYQLMILGICWWVVCICTSGFCFSWFGKFFIFYFFIPFFLQGLNEINPRAAELEESNAFALAIVPPGKLHGFWYLRYLVHASFGASKAWWSKSTCLVTWFKGITQDYTDHFDLHGQPSAWSFF